MISTRMTRQFLLRIVALALATVLILFLFQITSHFHANGQDQTACNRCQLAHLGFDFAKTASLLPAPLLAIGRAFALVLSIHQGPVSHHSPSRAPPTA